MRSISLKEVMDIMVLVHPISTGYLFRVFGGMLTEAFETRKTISRRFPLDQFQMGWIRGLPDRGYKVGLKIDDKTNNITVRLTWREHRLNQSDPGGLKGRTATDGRRS